MDQRDDRDEDDILDERRDAVVRAIEQGGSGNLNEDDQAFLQLAEEVVGSDDKDENDDGDENGGDEHDDDDEDDDVENGHDNEDEEVENSEDDEALKNFLPDDIQNDPTPREYRD